ncbi:MAG: FAD-dependent oxidoreductase [Desulfobacteraceae bacterium]|nr:FAD-dependent oxidoreductase [Desulfobacteraceae bacterium]
MECIACDVLVIGSGAAGLRAAIAVREAGFRVIVLSKARPGKSTCTGLSGGVMAGSVDAASLEAHLEQTLLAGRGLNQPDLARVLVREAPDRLRELLGWGIRAESRQGYLFAGGRPPVMGEAIVHCLAGRNVELGTEFLGGFIVTDLAVEDGAAGVNAWLRSSAKRVRITAGAVVLAAGGAGGLFLRHDNPRSIVGDGYRLAIEAGAALQDMEFVQFYPLCLSEPGLPAALIPPRLADCGLIANTRGEDILEKYGIRERPAGARARDTLSRALFEEINRRGETVSLEIRGRADRVWREDPFSASVKHRFVESYGALSRPLRIAPAAHHVMGGVIMRESGETSVPGLFAAGEVAGGLHGANRMGGNALSDTLVFGARAGRAAAEFTAKSRNKGDGNRAISLRLDECMRKWERLCYPGKGVRERLQRVMWRDGGLIRSAESLDRAMQDVREIRESMARLSPGGGDLPEIVELHSMTMTAGLILEAALKRAESRGAHYREDFPDQDNDHWRGHLQVRMMPDGQRLWRFSPGKE